MTRLVTCGAILLSLIGALSTALAALAVLAAPAAAAEFEDIPYLQVRINQVLESEPTGAEIEWRNEATGSAGVIRVLKTYFPSPGAPCRDYERTTRRPGGGEELVHGTGCRDASGRWALKERDESEAGAAGTPRLDGEPPSGPGGPAGEAGPAGQAGAAGGAAAQSQVQGAGQAGRNGASGAEATAAPQPAAKTETAAPEATAPEAKAPESKEPEAAASPPPRAPDPPAFDLPTPSQ
jgi:hypothetical protein